LNFYEKLEQEYDIVHEHSAQPHPMKPLAIEANSDDQRDQSKN